ncbi:MAG TPA: hypothetical protein PLO37_00335 [Candidatus Hydrogenedentes bacterium]|nr:hypothetical protein [Candidatus Hydrogenedentota bacterium]HPG65260.1 hypothetical protein [Candidatus Hydrogenedentota bacterium]
MKAGFARECITPPLGTTMMGFGGRDMDHGCDGIHDDIHARAIYVEHQGEPALIMGFDLCFLGREEADRFKGAIGRVMDLLPRQIFLNTSHNHVGPSVGTWYSAGYETPERDYLNQLERATVAAACRARDEARDATLSAGCTRTALPVNRRRPNEAGQIENRPYPDGKVYDRLPLCLFEDTSGKPICLLFSISTHPSMMSGWEISAEYPGAAMRCLDEYLGTPCSLFLQGVGGDSKPLVIGRGVDRWIPGTWELMDEAGAMVANEAIEALKKGLEPIEPHVQTASVEMAWALEPTPPRVEFEAVVENTAPESRPRDVQCLWAQHQLELLDKGLTLPTAVTLTAHGIRLGEGLRLIGIEGEAVHEWGYFIEDFYSGGTTFPLGYTDGTGLYLPTSRMLPEGGYEVVSSWEYGLPSRLAPGMEVQVTNALRHLRKRGIA